MTVTQVAAWVVLLVLALGFPRFLVDCSGPHCDGLIKIAGVRGSCCEHEGRDPQWCEQEQCEASEGDLGEVAWEGHCDCTEGVLEIGTGPLPERVSLEHDSQPCFQPIDLVLPESPHANGLALRPPTTGPPRTDQRTALLASTLLLL